MHLYFEQGDYFNFQVSQYYKHTVLNALKEGRVLNKHLSWMNA